MITAGLLAIYGFFLFFNVIMNINVPAIGMIFDISIHMRSIITFIFLFRIGLWFLFKDNMKKNKR